MTARMDAIISALGIPAGARISTRIPKKVLTEQGAPTAADKRAIQDGIEDLYWVGALKPNSVGIKAFADDEREYLEVAVLTVALRPGAKAARLAELIHRAIPYPLLLLSDDGGAVTLSLAHKRWAQNEAGKVVIEDVVATPPLKDLTGVTEQLFLASLPVAKQPSRDLLALFEGWRARIEALNAAQIVGTFITSDDPEVVGRRRRALDEYARLTKEETQLRAQAARAKQMNQRVELNQRIKSIRDDLARHKVLLSGRAA